MEAFCFKLSCEKVRGQPDGSPPPFLQRLGALIEPPPFPPHEFCEFWVSKMSVRRTFPPIFFNGMVKFVWCPQLVAVKVENHGTTKKRGDGGGGSYLYNNGPGLVYKAEIQVNLNDKSK